MTFIELFAKLHIENVCSSLIAIPDQIILIGDSAKKMDAEARHYTKLLQGRGYCTKISFRAVKRNNMPMIIKVLTDIIFSNEDCVFDITGGEETYLIAVGMLAKLYPEKHVQIHKINLHNGSIIDCDMDGHVMEKHLDPSLSVDEYITLFGGCRQINDADTIYNWNTDDAFIDDLKEMWEVCRTELQHWNRQCACFANIQRHSAQLESGAYRARIAELNNLAYCRYNSILKKLSCSNLLHYKEEDGFVEISYKNSCIKACLSTAGQILETVVYSIACSLLEKDGKPFYSDVQNHVVINWDGVENSTANINATNEVDILMTKGMIPIFVSCKNGHFDTEELYKLNSVAQYFGGKYAKKILITTALRTIEQSNPSSASAIKARAEELNIRLVTGLEKLKYEQLGKVIRTFAN